MEQNIVYRNITYRLYPGSAATAKRLLRIWDACRFAWNEVKAAYELQYEHACGREIAQPTFMTFGPAFTELRKQHEWLQEMPYTVVRYSLYYLAEAYKGFLKGERGYPRWQNRFRDPSFTIPQDVRTDGDTLFVPKVGKLKIQRRGGNPYPDGQAVKAVVKRVGRRWYAVICYKVAEPLREHDGRAIGVDRNVGQVADSEGEIHRMPDLRQLEAKLKRHRRALSRKRKGSKRRKDARRKVTRAARRLANARKAWLHRTSRKLAEKAGTVVIEKLNTRGMTRSARGARDEPGRNVGAKAGLNRGILNTGWSAMEQMLSYKAVELVRVPAAFTSQTCSACGMIDADSRRSQESFKCVACGHAQNADLNAARNILASATGASARRGAFTSVTPKTRETDTEGLRHFCI